jgi:hypothetical protein
MLVLLKDQRIGEGADALPHVAEDDATPPLAGDPQGGGCVKVRVVDKAAEPGTTSRALAAHARILEFYDQIGLAEAIVDRGLKVASSDPRANPRGNHTARI